MTNLTHERVTGWLVPTLLALTVSVLSWIAVTLNEISTTLAVAVYRIEDHERRILNLETLYLRP